MLARRFYIDIQQRAFVAGANTTLPASSAAFTRADSETIELYFLRPSTEVTRAYDYADYSNNTVKLAIGNTGNATSGTFKLSDGTNTTSALAHNVTASDLKTAFDALGGNAGLFAGGACTVTGELPRFIVTVGADNTGSVSTLATDDNELAPATNVRFIQRQAAAASKPLIFDLVFERQPAVLASSWSALPGTVTASVTTLVTGGAGTSEQQKYTFDREPDEGTYSIKFPSRAATVSSVAAGVFTAANHGFYNGQTVALSAFTISASSFANASYYIVNRTNDTFGISATAGGTAITADATTGGTATIADTTTPPIDAQASAFEVSQAIAAAGFVADGAPQIVVSGVPRQFFLLEFANGSTGIDFPQIEIVASSLAPAKGLSGTIDFNTMGVRDLISAGENANLTMEVEVTSTGSSTQTYTQAASISPDIITAATQPTPPVTTYNAGFMRVETGITGLTGGGATNLDGLITANGTYPTGIVVFLVISGVPQIWQLTSGTTAEDAANGVVRPDDYATTSNEKIWLQRM